MGHDDEPPIVEIPPLPGGKCGEKRSTKGPVGEDLFCTQPAGFGTDHPGIGACKWHRGATPNGRTHAARRRVADITDSVRGQLAGFYGLNAPEAQVNPVEVLAEELARCRAVVAWIEAMVGQWSYDRARDPAQGGGAVLREAGVDAYGGLVDEERVPDQTTLGANALAYDRLPELRLTGLPPLLTVVRGIKNAIVTDSEYRAWLRQLGEERDRLRVTAKLAIDTGLDERMTRVAEAGGLLIVQAIALVLDRMGLADRRGELDVLVPQALEAVHQRQRVEA